MRALRENHSQKENRRREKTVKEDRLRRVILGVQMQGAQRIRAVANRRKSGKNKT